MKFRVNLKPKTRVIDPAPLLDVFLQVIIFFILATQFIGRPGLRLELPAAGTTAIYKGDIAVVALNGCGLSFKEREVTLAELKQEFEKLKTKDKETILVIEADKDIPHARIVEIIDLAQGTGLRHLAIATAEEEERIKD